ncbi:hypothetical protein BJX63DRAFT_247621 [Aspergillus granulosus]|uniref:SET domain-containing protein n=1 Tax=Aspergillus granulosus TaxID=176169 RepID=A0ABR4HA96_9EURO
MPEPSPERKRTISDAEETTLRLKRIRDMKEVDAQTNNKPKRDLNNYSARVQQKVRRLVSKILASVYYDINTVCIMRTNARLDPNFENTARYRIQFQESTALLDRVVSYNFDPTPHADQRGILIRLDEFVKLFGWKMLSICMLAEGFQRACREISHPAIWKELIKKFKDNRMSLEVFARSRNLDWRGQLLKYASMGVPNLEKELEPARGMWQQHPHHVVQSVDNKVKRPIYKNCPQINIDECIINPNKWLGKPEDPTMRTIYDGRCDLCRSPGICDCKLDPSAGTLVELVERPGTGTGVRALTNFKKGGILGPFIGELLPPEYMGDPDYALAHVSKKDMSEVIATISPRHHGNWTRYIAHSCNASTAFRARTIGDRTIMTIEAERDIPAFEDITVDYGKGYWIGKTCLCGESNCVSKKTGG